MDFLQEFLNNDGTKEEEGDAIEPQQQEQSSNMQSQIINQNSQGEECIPGMTAEESAEVPHPQQDAEYSV